MEPKNIANLITDEPDIIKFYHGVLKEYKEEFNPQDNLIKLDYKTKNILKFLANKYYKDKEFIINKTELPNNINDELTKLKQNDFIILSDSEEIRLNRIVFDSEKFKDKLSSL